MDIKIYTLKKGHRLKGLDLFFFKDEDELFEEVEPPEVGIGNDYQLKDKFELAEEYINYNDLQETLEAIYSFFKTQSPILISDIVAIGNRYFFCDDADFKEVVI